MPVGLRIRAVPGLAVTEVDNHQPEEWHGGKWLQLHKGAAATNHHANMNVCLAATWSRK
jgi:hypothetical protein